MNIDSFAADIRKMAADINTVRAAAVELVAERDALLQSLQVCRSALADIWLSPDIDITLARKKAERIYKETGSSATAAAHYPHRATWCAKL